MELKKAFVLAAVFRAKRSAAERHNHWIVPLQFGQFSMLAGVICQFVIRAAANARVAVALLGELRFEFVAPVVRSGSLTHLIVLRFGNAFFEHLRTLAPSLGIFIFSE